MSTVDVKKPEEVTSQPTQKKFIPFDQRENWKDIKPIPQDEGPHKIIGMTFTPEFLNTMDYFRAIVHKGEISDRAFEIAGDVMDLNYSNYTAFYYRRLCLFALKKDLKKELELTTKALMSGNHKSANWWYHRQEIVKAMEKVDWEGEKAFFNEILKIDTKNYNTWVYRQWLVKNYNLWEGELEFTEKLLLEDIRSNSVWNYRFFVLENTVKDWDTRMRLKELVYSFKMIIRAPNNEAAWNYCKGIATAKGGDDQICDFLVQQCENLLKRAPENVKGHATIIELCERKNTLDALKHAEEYAEKLIKLDVVRKKYWAYRQQCIQDAMKQLN